MLKDEHKVIIIAIIASAAFWLIDSTLDSIIFAKKPFLDQLIFNISAHEIYMRVFTVSCLILFALLITRYITKNKEMESRYRQLFNNINDAIFVLPIINQNQHGKFIEVNDEACRRLGYTRDELLELSVADVNSFEDVQRLPERMQQLRSAGHVLFETVHVAKDGHRIPVEVNIHLVDFKGKPTILAMARDITARRQAQEALEKAHGELEQRVIERTAELTQVNQELLREMAEHRRTTEALQDSEQKLRHLATRLLTAQEEARRRMAQELHEEMGQTLLAMKLQIRSIKDNLQKGKPEDPASLVADCDHLLQYFQAMVENIRRLSRDLSPAILEDLGLAAAIKNLFEEFCQYHQHLKTSINMDEIGDLLSKQDQINIYRICQESLTNIGKHADPTHLWLTVNKQEDRFSFVLEDNGQRFNLPNPLSGETRAQDLGLAAVDERVRLLGGVLRIESSKGQGTRIIFDVPVKARG
jgi:PAS domain S-box-containing protein